MTTGKSVVPPLGENSSVTFETAFTFPSRKTLKKRNWSAAGQPAVTQVRSGDATRFEILPGPSNIRVSGMSRQAPRTVQSERRSAVESAPGS